MNPAVDFRFYTLTQENKYNSALRNQLENGDLR